MITSPALAAFNLVCMVQGVFFDHQPQKQKDFPIEYRVDLTRNRFCTGGCNETRPIARLTETDIYLATDRDKDDQNIEFIRISRESGGYVWILGEGSKEVRTIGTCEKHPFSGFPAREF